MKTNSFSVKAVKLLLTVLLIIEYVLSGLLILMLIIRLSGIGWADKLDLNLKTGVNYEIEGFVKNSIPAELEFNEATIHLKLSEIKLPVFLLHTVSVGLVLFAMIYCTRLFLSNINSIIDGQVFNLHMAERFKRIGYIMSAFSLLPPVYLFVVMTLLDPEFEGVSFRYSFGPNWSLLLSGLFLIVVSEMVVKGLELQNENELTI